MFDRLFDITVMLPSIFSRADRIIPDSPTLARRLKAQDLLANCLNIDMKFDLWHKFVSQGTEDYPQVYWVEESDGSRAQIPFAEDFAFKDGMTCVMFLYYWMSLMLFHRCIESLHNVIFQPVIEDYPNMFPDLPTSLQVNLMKYQQQSELASNICRSLDFALNTTAQPDMLVAPLTVVHEWYRDISEACPETELDLLWCEGFKARLIAKGEDIANVLRSKSWAEIGRF
jgi:(R)-2-hydroxyglutarate---pyruvate transhydrogenase